MNVHEAKSQLSKLLQEVDAGERIVIARDGEPVAVLVPYAEVSRKRRLGGYEGQVRIAEDFDELPDDLAEALGARE